LPTGPGPYRNFGSELALVLDRCHVVEEVPQKADMSTKQMTTDELAQVLLPNGYVFENGTPFYEQIGEKRARELQNALHTKGYKIESIRNLRRANLQDREGPLQTHMRRR
jgi:hypothetical protein